MDRRTDRNVSEDRLARVLHSLRMRSTFYCHAELREPWALEMPAVTDSVSFHVITAGSCWVRLPAGNGDGEEPVELRAGDLALVPHGRGHELLSHPGAGPAARVDLLPQHYVTEQLSVLEHGSADTHARAAQLICGVVSFDEPAAQALMRSLPALLLVRGDDGAAATSVRDTLRLMAGELARPQPGGESVATRLADVLVILALRHWLASDPGVGTGWYRALQDERIGRALEAIHADPGAEWTLERLARTAAMSRSTFSARFTELTGEAPIAYLTHWRMTVARSRLLAEDVTAARLAADLGYHSEAAFSRAFRRVVGHSPGATRTSPPRSLPRSPQALVELGS
ncbi:AraC family transcriptional regulator [Salana multivorans]